MSVVEIEPSNPNYILEIQTVQIAPFRTLMTALKDILLDTNIVFSQEGIKIVSLDKSLTIMVRLHLEADKFEKFFCAYPKIIIAVNMFQLFKLINSIDNDDTLTIFIEKDHYHDGIVEFLGLKFENGEIKQCKTQYLRLIELEPEEAEIPNLEFSSIINLPSADFQKIIRDFRDLSDAIEIKSVGDELMFSLDGPFAKVQIRRSECGGNMEYTKKQDSTKIIQGEFSLKYLSYFVKCTNLCNSIELMLENDLPLVVKYNVASLGTILLALCPVSVSGK